MKQHGLAANPFLRSFLKDGPSGKTLTPTEKASPKTEQGWQHITDDLKHSMDMWSILETRAQKVEQSPIDNVRDELEKLKGIMDQFAF